MTDGGGQTTVRLSGRVKQFARSNLAALLTGQALLTLFNAAILFMVNRVYARPGDTADAGRLAMVMAMALGLALLAVGGVARSVTLRIAQARAANGPPPREVIGRVIATGLVLAGALGVGLMVSVTGGGEIVRAAAAAWMPERLTEVQAYLPGVRLAAMWLPSFAFILVMVAIFDGFQEMQWSLLAEAGTYAPLRFVMGAAVMLALGWAWTGLAGAWAVSYALSVILVGVELAVFLKRRGQRVLWNRLMLRDMTKDAAVLFLPTTATMLVSQAGILAAWMGGGATASATFWVTWSAALAAVEFCQPVGRVLFPAMPNLRRDAGGHQITRVLRTSFWGISGLMLAAIIALNVTKGWILQYLHQEPHALALTILSAAAFFEAYRAILNPVLLGVGRGKVLSVVEWISLMLLMVLGPLATIAWGVAGLAAVFGVLCFAGAAVRVAMVARATGVRLYTDMAAATLAVAAIMAAVVAFDTW